MAELTYSLETFTASDGYSWHYRRYPARGTTYRGALVFLHGIQSHAGWYENSSTKLAQAGWEVFFLDRRGSGMNHLARGDTPSFRRLLDDVAEFLQALPRTQYPVPSQDPLLSTQEPQAADSQAGTRSSILGTQDSPGSSPLNLAGISWGGKLALALERRHPGLVDGLILLCPGLFPRIRPGLGQRLKILFTRLVRPRKLFPIPLNDPELFTANPRWQEFLRQDGLALHQATARFLVESARLDGYLRFAAKYVHVPVLLLLAGRDRIIQNDRTKSFVESLATPDKQAIEYPEAHHTLEFEENPDRFLKDMMEWLERKREKRMK